MTVAAVDPRVVYQGTSSGTFGPFAVSNGGTPIEFQSNAVIKVYRYASITAQSGTLLVEGTDYTLTGGPTNGQVLLTAPQTGLLSAERLEILRDEVLSQDLSLEDAGAFRAADVQERLDTITRQIQDVDLRARRSIAQHYLDTTSMTLPEKGARASKIAAFDAEGNLTSLDSAIVAGAPQVLSPYHQTYTGDGTTTDFTLPVAPAGVSFCDVFVDGVKQSRLSYSLSGTALQFSEAPPTSAFIEVDIKYFGANSVVDLLEFDATQVIPLADNATLVARAGVTSGQIFRTRGAVTDLDGGEGFWQATNADFSADATIDVGRGLTAASTGTTGIYFKRIALGSHIHYKFFEGSDDEERVQRMLTVADGRLCRVDGAVTITRGLTTDKSVRMDARGASFAVNANVKFIDAVADGYEVSKLTSNYTVGATTLAVTALTRIPAEGEWIKILSDAVSPFNRDEGSNALQYRVGQWVRVKSATATVITLEKALDYVEGVSPTSTSGDEALVEAYTTALNARIFVPEQGKVFEWQGGTITYEDGHDADSWNSSAMVIGGYGYPKVRELTIDRCYWHGVDLLGTFGARVVECHFSNFSDDAQTGNGNLGYAVAPGGDVDTRIVDCTGHNVRHLVTTNEITGALDETTTERLLGMGRSEGGIVWGCTASGGVTVPLDTHHSAYNWVFAFCETRDTDGHGIQYRGQRGQIIGFKCTNVAGDAIRVFTEYESGDPDDDFYTANKTIGPSTCLVSSADVECSGRPFYAGNSRRVLIDGNFVARASGTRMIEAENSNVLINGMMRLEVSDLDGAATIDSTADYAIFAAKYVSDLPHAQGIVFQSGADVYVDATNAAGTGLKLCSAETTAFIVNRRRIRALLNSSFSIFDDTYSGTCTCEGSGHYVVSQSGTDSGLIVNYAEHSQNWICTADGSGEVNGTAVTGATLFVDRSNNISTTHNGTGSFVDAVWTVPHGYTVSLLDASNTEYDVLVEGQKTGTNGALEFRIDWAGTVAISSISLPATATLWKIRFRALGRGDNDQLIRVDVEYHDSTTPGLQRLSSTETVNIASSTEGARFDVNAASGDTCVFENYALHASGFIKGFTG